MNQKSEIRISKYETISKFECQISKTLWFPCLCFEFWSLEFVSGFGFRASDLKKYNLCLFSLLQSFFIDTDFDQTVRVDQV